MHETNLKSAIGYVESIDLSNIKIADSASNLESLGEVDPTKLSGKEDALVVGSQIVEFASQLSPEMRLHVSNTFLLAKLTADLEVQKTGSESNWYPKYFEILTRTGWTVETATGVKDSFEATNLQVNKQIIPFLTLLFGPAVSAGSLILNLLENLDEMDKATPWITLFERNARQLTANQFQVSYVAADSNDNPAMKLAQFELTAEKQITQVLFFKLQETSVSLTGLSKTFSANESLFTTLKDTVKNKISRFTTDYISEIDLDQLGT